MMVALEHFGVREHGVAEEHGLRALQVRVTAHDFVAEPETDIRRSLIVPASRGVKFLAGGANLADQRGFDVHVHIFARGVPFELVGTNLPFDRAQAAFDLRRFGLGEQTDLRQAFRVRDRAGDVLSIEPPVEAHAFRECFDRLRRPGREPPPPRSL